MGDGFVGVFAVNRTGSAWRVILRAKFPVASGFGANGRGFVAVSPAVDSGLCGVCVGFGVLGACRAFYYGAIVRA